MFRFSPSPLPPLRLTNTAMFIRSISSTMLSMRAGSLARRWPWASTKGNFARVTGPPGTLRVERGS